MSSFRERELDYDERKAAPMDSPEYLSWLADKRAAMADRYRSLGFPVQGWVSIDSSQGWEETIYVEYVGGSQDGEMAESWASGFSEWWHNYQTDEWYRAGNHFANGVVPLNHHPNGPPRSDATQAA